MKADSTISRTAKVLEDVRAKVTRLGLSVEEVLSDLNLHHLPKSSPISYSSLYKYLRSGFSKNINSENYAALCAWLKSR